MSYHKTTAIQAALFFKTVCAALELIGCKKLRSTPARPGKLEHTVSTTRDPKRQRIPGQHARADYEITTIYGRLELHVYNNWVPCRFDNDRPGHNSKKWNHYFSFIRSTYPSEVQEFAEALQAKVFNLLSEKDQNELRHYLVNGNTPENVQANSKAFEERQKHRGNREVFKRK